MSNRSTAPHLAVSIGSLHLPNPVLTASGTFGYAKEFEDLVNLHHLGGIIAKGISLLPRHGNPPPRVLETPCGMLNAIGLENVGVTAFLRDKMNFLRNCGAKIIVNILGDTVQEYRELAHRLADQEGISAVEVNISCPNVTKGGVAFGTDPVMAAEVTRAVRSAWPGVLMVKLSPNVTDITVIARAVEEAGADAISLINTLLGMAIDTRSRRPCLANMMGGLSGPAIKPVALRMVWQAVGAVKIPVIGIGGISTATDAIEFLLAGATAVQIGTANFVDPKAPEKIIAGIRNYLEKNDFDSVRSIIGLARTHCAPPEKNGICTVNATGDRL